MSGLVSTAGEDTGTGIVDVPQNPVNDPGNVKGGKQREYESHNNTQIEEIRTPKNALSVFGGP